MIYFDPLYIPPAAPLYYISVDNTIPFDLKTAWTYSYPRNSPASFAPLIPPTPIPFSNNTGGPSSKS
jgi:hypothetical protein